MKPALYIAYISGAGGANIALFYISGTVVAGIDGGTGKYIGRVERTQDGGLKASVTLTIPPGVPLLTGAPPLESPVVMPLDFELPPGFEDGSKVVTIASAFGAVNARVEKMMELE